MMDVDESGVEEEHIPKFVVKASNEAKLRELLHNITSTEIKLCSYASKEFIKLLKGDSGHELLHQYIQNSSKCSELLEAWRIRRGNLGMSYILSLISAILSHPDGKYKPDDVGRISITRVLDKLARSIVEEKMEDVYKEMSSKEAKRQTAALLLIASIVRRSSGLALEVAKSFNFKLTIFPKLAEYKMKQIEKKVKHSTRKPFISFAMSFLEMGKPGLLRWVLQQKEMYSGVLRGLGNDDEETILYVLSTLRDRVLIEESLVPPSLRSVLFGSVTLEKLVSISGRENGGPAAEMAHSVLIMVCTDPSNGLMPDLNKHPNPLRGNPKRILGLMRKLKATEVGYHRDLLLAIVRGRPSFGSSYMDEFPYNLEDFASSTWFAAVSLAANLISTVAFSCPVGFLDFQSQDPPSFNSPNVQYIMKCICPRPFRRSVVNKGLLHADSLVKHGTLRLLLESLKLLNSFMDAINNHSYSNNQIMYRWVSLKQEIQNEVQTSLPDSQVLLTLLSSLSSRHKSSDLCLKRAADLDSALEHNMNGMKKQRTAAVNEDVDILISGISSAPDILLSQESEKGLCACTAEKLDSIKDQIEVIAEIWGLHASSMPVTALKDAEIYFHSKLLDALKIFYRIFPALLEGSFDFFKIIPSNPFALPTVLQQSLLSFLIECIGWCPKRGIPVRTAPMMYKHLHPFINLLIYSSFRDIKDQAYVLAQAAMLSTGAFDKNSREIVAWFLFLPGYSNDTFSVEDERMEVFQNLSSVVVSFLCDAISSVGNNLFKYLNRVRSCAYHLKGTKDVSPDFSPLVICVLEKCLRLLSSDSGTFTLPEKSMISLFVSNTLSYIVQTQVEGELLSSLIDMFLSERFGDRFFTNEDSKSLCEWRPLKKLHLFLKSIRNRQLCGILSIDRESVHAGGSFANTLSEVQKIVSSEHDGGLVGITKAFSFSMICATPDEILQNFPSVMSISQSLLGLPLSVLFSVVFLEGSLIGGVSKLWPEMFFHGLEMAVDGNSGEVNTSRRPINCSSLNCGSDSIDSVSVAFSLFLKQVPFYVLFPVLMSFDDLSSLEHLKLRDLLLAKLSELTIDQFISSFRLVLFWIDQIRSTYKIKPSGELERLSEICFFFIEHILMQLLIVNPASDRPTVAGAHLPSQYIQEVVETIFCHPAVAVSSALLQGFSKDFTNRNIGHNLENLLCLCKQRVHKMDYHPLILLTTTLDHFLALCYGQKCDVCTKEHILKAFRTLVQQLFLIFRTNFDLCMKTEDLAQVVPTLCTLYTLIPYISPFELLELVDWILSRLDVNEMMLLKSFKDSALSVGLCIAGRAFEILSSSMGWPNLKTETYDLFWGLEEKNALFERIYFKTCEFSTCCKLDVADLCLLRAVNAACLHRYWQQQSCLLPSTFAMLRVIQSTPMEIVSHCIYRTNVTKAELLFLLVEVSPNHMSAFGCLISDILNKRLLLNKMEGTCSCSISDEDYMMLLPAALLFLDSTLMKLGELFYKHFRSISSHYSRILLDGFVNWRSYVSGDIFKVDFGEFLPSSLEEVFNIINCSLLVKAVHMLQHHFALSGSMTLKKRLKLFNSICSESGACNGLLECDVGEIDSYSFNQSINFVNRVVAKISICKLLLFPKDDKLQSSPKEADGKVEVIWSKLEFSKEVLSRIQLIKILVHAWQLIVKKFPSISNEYLTKGTNCLLFKFLEVHILTTVTELTTNMYGNHLLLDSLPFIEQFARSSFLYRFEDPKTQQMLQTVLTLSGKSSRVLVLQLLLAHSQFAPSLNSVSKSSGYSQIGTFFRPMSSILGSLVIPRKRNDPYASDGKESPERSELKTKQLEVIKLLRILYHSDSVSEIDFGIDSKELLFLLLSSYGATLSEIDLEIYNLMHEIESFDGLDGNVAEMDYLWGVTAVKIRNERAQEQGIVNDVVDNEAAEERRRSLFRENLPIDPKMCAATVLYFPYDRTADDGPFHQNKIQRDNLTGAFEMKSAEVERTQQYDPVYILRLSIHSLSMGYLEPLEFASLGLLAVAFVSISSPSDGIRKMGYEALGKFKGALENCKRGKDAMRLRLLLTYLQNGIEEPCQRIPSITAVFAAEASLILLDPAHDHYSTIWKLLMHSPKMNIKSVPLFHNFFWSSSINFKADRLWILRLLYAGLNVDDDAHIYIRNSILEILLSFYTSPLSDNASKELILLIVKKSVKLNKMTYYLVEHCGLISWLSSVFSICEGLCSGQNKIVLGHLTMVLEVVNDILASRDIVEWLKNFGLEQLSEFSSHLHRVLVGGSKLNGLDVPLANMILQVLVSTLNISQKRKIYQPHFTLSSEGLFQIYEIVDAYKDARSSPTAKFALKAMLMTTPPVSISHMDQKKLSHFIMWSISTALLSDSARILHPREYGQLRISSEEEQSDDSLIEKLLRWLIASVILGRVSCKSNDSDLICSVERSNLESLQSLLDYIEKGCGGNRRSCFGCEEILAPAIFYLQQLLGMKCRVLPSVVAALCLLLLSGASCFSGMLFIYELLALLTSDFIIWHPFFKHWGLAFKNWFQFVPLCVHDIDMDSVWLHISNATNYLS
ncbi:uncharacterized protein LOC131166095 isoform X2 [Malania oleifera]|uniref:uncharacterized protein LOC131166095 isoform X2 n=1 Tax=Malania oleifera TaxID=397392 RepID=UPI0025AE7B02|nr:uncharacterized protein LOC131166095 isoform X2 [Malania oleifera]XP_057980384.1 uncharacterized protein LOC131166095 isoform X2 [Malania oleifera]XP_057980392.1 uncharacterized protein LOC131166095 isoform X2 [Malania oleifera]